ncbi:MAG TPA: LacI family DNA-binding transcriptional regulator [Ktedonobacterales bacterium]|nr:LacI family DNA-binding transcriptional regulator [Ktedonobacterales bacterium]
MAGKLTIQDIARLAGVSKATVSRVLNHKPDVDPTTRERILRIMQEQGFVPSITAAGLAGGRPRIIGVLVPSLIWPFIPEIVQGVAEYIEKSSYELILYSLSYAPGEGNGNGNGNGKNLGDRSAAVDRILDARLTAGLVAITPGPSAKHLTLLHEQGFPVVLIDDQGLPTSAPWVGADNRIGAYQAVRHLISLGHRRIAHIKGPASYQCSQERYQGYCQALTEAGLHPDPTLVMQGDFEIPTGRIAAQTLFARSERPTAIFAANDHMAWGVLEVAENLGLRVPEDVAVVGFDDMPTSVHKRPALTTVSQPFHQMGLRAGELLLGLLESPRHVPLYSGTTSFLKSSFLPSAYNEPMRILLETKLVVRESCGAHQMTPLPNL